MRKMQVWNDYDPIWYETENISKAEVKILVKSGFLNILNKINSINGIQSSIGMQRNFLVENSVEKTLREYLENHDNFGSFQYFDKDIFYELIRQISHNYILFSHSKRIIKKWVKSWVIFKLYHPPGITRTSVTGKIYGNANGGLRYRTSRDRFRQLKYKMNRKDDE